MTKRAEGSGRDYKDGDGLLLRPHCSSKGQAKEQDGDLEKNRK
jgi:hypothetical protein